MLSPFEIKTLKSVVTSLMTERTNPISVTEIAVRIHETEAAESIWLAHRGDYPGGNGYRISGMIEDLPSIKLVGTLELGTGACFAWDTSMPITFHEAWQPWGAINSAQNTTVVSHQGALSTSERDRLLLFIQNLIGENGGKVLSSFAGEQCLTDPAIVPLRSRFSSFSMMLAELSPEICQIREEPSGTNYLVFGTEEAPQPDSASQTSSLGLTTSGYPKTVDIESEESKTAVAEMHAFAFMGWWNVTSKTLRRLTGFNGNNQQVWCAIIAEEWKKAKRENKLIYHTTSIRRPEEAICVFNTGLVSTAGQGIYFILSENPVPNRQPWSLCEITVTNDSSSVFSPLLTTELHLREARPHLQAMRRIRLINALRAIRGQHLSIGSVLRQMEDGYLLTKNDITEVRNYLDSQLELRSSGLLMGLGISAEAAIRFDDLVSIVGDNPAVGYLESLEENLRKVLEIIADTLKDILGIGNIYDEAYPTGKCKALLDEASEGIFDEGSTADYISKYAFWLEKLSELAGLLWHRDKSKLDTISADLRQTSAIMNFISDTLSEKEEEQLRANQLDELLDQAETMLKLAASEMRGPEAVQPTAPEEDEDQREEGRPLPLPVEEDNRQAADEPLPDGEDIPEPDLDDLLDEILSDTADESISGLSSPAAAETAPPKAKPAKKTKSAGEEPNRSEDILDEELIRACREGETEPETTPMETGPWHMEASWVLDSAVSAETPELRMLTDPDMRTWSNMTACLCHALFLGNTEAAENLLFDAPPGVTHELFSFLLCIQKILNRPEDTANQLYTANQHLRALLSDPSYSAAAHPAVALSVAAALPILSSRVLQKTAMVDVFETIEPMTFDPEVAAGIAELKAHLFSERADDEYKRMQDVTVRFRSAINKSNREQTLEKLREKGQRLSHSFSESTITYANARKVLYNLSNAEKSPRTYEMLQSLTESKAAGRTLPFRDKGEIEDYIDDLQRSLYHSSRVETITGGYRLYIVRQITELNAAYRELLGILAADTDVSVYDAEWFMLLGSAQQTVSSRADAAIREQLPYAPLRDVLLNYCAVGPGDPPWDPMLELSTVVEYGNGEIWPLLEDDKRIVSLIDLGGLAEKVFTVSRPPQTSSVQEFTDVATGLIRRCYGAAAMLSDLKWANVIDEREYKELSGSLSRSIGWLRRYCDLLKAGNTGPNELPPLLRNDIEIWYCEQRIRSRIEHMAEIIENEVKGQLSLSPENAGLIRAELQKSVQNSDIRGMMNRFSDLVTKVSMLKEDPQSVDLFFSRRIYDSIYYTIKGEKWSSGVMQGIEAVSDEITRVLRFQPTYPVFGEAKKIGAALSSIKRAADPSELANNRSFLEDLVSLFRFLGFIQPSLEVQNSDLYLSFGVQDRSICPLSELGRGIMTRSEGGRGLRARYRIQPVDSVDQISGLLTTIQPDTTSEYTILLCPFEISFDERRELIMRSRSSESNHTYFLLDKCFIRFAMFFSEHERMKAFYSCCTHLMRLSPYDVNTVPYAGAGIFFGRSSEIERIMNAPGASVIYGGRRLGKTSIMRELEWRWLNQNNSNLAVYLDLKNEDNLRPEITLWYLIARNLSGQIKDLIRFPVNTGAASSQEIINDAQEIIEIIRSHLQTSGGKLLLLLDESDKLIYRDTVRHREHWEEGSRINELIKLINVNENRVKVVMAGLDRVTRFVRNLNAYQMQIDPNWEVFQRFNNNIPLQPMVGNDMKNAYDLVDLPFKMMGYKLDHQSIKYILRVSCFRPNLIQNYCSHLLTQVHTDHEITFLKDSLYLDIPNEKVVSIYESQGSSAKFLESQRDQSIRIPLNVGVTLVYAPVAYAVALMSFRESIRGMFIGFTPQEVLAEILKHNQQFADNTASALEYMTTILNDLSIMGVLRSIHENGTVRYALFSHYMLQMLGDEAHIRTELEANLKIYVERNSRTSEEVREMYADRFSTDDDFSPMTIVQTENFRTILENNGCAVVVGSEMLLLHKVPEVLRQMKLWGSLHHVVAMTAAEYDLLDIDSVFSPDQDGKTPLIIVNEGWTQEMVREIENLHRSNADIMVIMTADPRVCASQPEMLAGIPEQNIIHLTRLERSFRNSWFERTLELLPERTGSSRGDRPEDLSRIEQIVGTWPQLTIDFRVFLKNAANIGLESVLSAFAQKVKEQAAHYWEIMGMTQVPSEIWDVIAGFERLSDCIAYAKIEGIDRRQILDAITYLYHMNVLDIDVTRMEDSEHGGLYRVDPYAIELGKAVAGR